MNKFKNVIARNPDPDNNRDWMTWQSPNNKSTLRGLLLSFLPRNDANFL